MEGRTKDSVTALWISFEIYRLSGIYCIDFKGSRHWLPFGCQYVLGTNDRTSPALNRPRS